MTNEHAMKAAREIDQIIADTCRTANIAYKCEPTWLPGVAEIITRTALEPATQELREALCTLINSAEYQRGTVHEISTYDIEKADAVLAKYPAKEK